MQPYHTRSGVAALLRWNLWSVRHLVRHPTVQLAMLWMPSHWIQASEKTDSNTSSDKAFEDKSLFWPFDNQPRAYSGLAGCLWIALHIFFPFSLLMLARPFREKKGERIKLTLELQGAQSINYTCNEACNNRVDKQLCGTGCLPNRPYWSY